MNPIARMMKRYIKMPLKYALPLLFIGALVLTSTTGCTSPSSNPTATPSAAVTSTPAPANIANLLTSKYVGEDYTVTKAFSLQTNNTYLGVVSKNNRSTNVTFIKRSSESDAQSQLNNLVNDYKARSYTVELQDKSVASLGKTASPNAAGKACRELVQISVEDIGGWGVITERTIYCDL